MIRFILLLSYFELMSFLQLSGRADQYINVHYQYLTKLSMALAFLLALVQLVSWTRSGHANEPHHHHGHTHSLGKPWQRMIAYLLLAYPIVAGVAFPTVSLDADIVSAKGFTFPISEESVGDPEMTTQYLKPDTSMYFNKTDYDKRMNHERQDYLDQDKIKITDDNYLTIMELIYNFPKAFSGKTIQYTGFIYQDPVGKETDTFLFRFGIIHCVADSGVFGLLVHLPEQTQVSNNDWVTVTGTIQMEYYPSFKTSIPTLKADKLNPAKVPSNEYVYRDYND
ncbi:TIGR03943 family putative permease subunit [Pisciglobus halotolerans]|uniref:Putative membrane protein n=1 Tax=Pisciglobus halotolerans TaxID=745365 RepID=A0A1I3BQL1_9LACT|nr:TIGR03943 family protein [Pisciglobus halotolerans]SFH64189.1 putative membrane protein [Pisciglobus halotolerans]